MRKGQYKSISGNNNHGCWSGDSIYDTQPSIDGDNNFGSWCGKRPDRTVFQNTVCSRTHTTKMEQEGALPPSELVDLPRSELIAMLTASIDTRELLRAENARLMDENVRLKRKNQNTDTEDSTGGDQSGMQDTSFNFRRD